MMTIALSGLESEIAFLYIDDLVILGCSIQNHFANLEKVFQRLQSCNLKKNPKKCRFFQKEVTYIGHLPSHPAVVISETIIHFAKHFPYQLF
jgi:Reverse transcriptase (RNA-dependent DNA polymerase)